MYWDAFKPNLVDLGPFISSQHEVCFPYPHSANIKVVIAAPIWVDKLTLIRRFYNALGLVFQMQSKQVTAVVIKCTI